MLEVVDAEKDFTSGEERRQAFLDARPGGLSQSYRLGDRRRDQGRLAERRKLDDSRPVPITGPELVDEREREPGLP